MSVITQVPCVSFIQVFGLKLVEIDPKSHVYVLINKLESVPEEPVCL